MDRVKVQDHSNLERDVKSNGIVNTNATKYYYMAFAESPFKTARAQ